MYRTELHTSRNANIVLFQRSFYRESLMPRWLPWNNKLERVLNENARVVNGTEKFFLYIRKITLIFV